MKKVLFVLFECVLAAAPAVLAQHPIFDQINLLLIPSDMSPVDQKVCFVTPLSPVQERILALLGLPTTLYTSLQLA